jgi:hypothetical protein
VFFRINGKDACAPVSVDAGAREGVRMRLAASVDDMHLISIALDFEVLPPLDPIFKLYLCFNRLLA